MGDQQGHGMFDIVQPLRETGRHASGTRHDTTRQQVGKLFNEVKFARDLFPTVTPRQLVAARLI